MVNLSQLGGEDPEVKRAEARRSRDNERLQKLHDGRLRSIGADIVGVKNQIEEKKQQKMFEKEQNLQKDEENEEIRRYLIQIESQEALAKRQEAIKIRQEWKEQTLQKQEKKIIQEKEKQQKIDIEKCGPGAAQQFEGEDFLQKERIRLQQIQVRDWSNQILQEKLELLQKDKEKEQEYHFFLQQIGQLQEELQKANEKEKALISLEIQKLNQQFVILKKEQQKEQKQKELMENEKELQTLLTSHLISENPLQAQLPGFHMGQRVRVDHWKGLSADQTKKLLNQNEKILQEKTQQKRLEKEEQKQEALIQQEIQRTLTEQEFFINQKKSALHLQVQESLEKQKMEQKEREKIAKQQAKGSIEKSFFQSFGKSYR